MNLRQFTVFSVVAGLFLGGCFIVQKSEATGGAGGTGGEAGVGVGGAGGAAGGGGTAGAGGQGTAGAGGQGTAGAGGGAGGAGGADMCIGCAEFVTPGSVGDLCKGTSTDLYDALANCSCNGACAAACAETLCKQIDASTECAECIQKGGCATEFGACAGDI